MKKNILLIISIVIFIAAILTSGAMTNWWQGESKNITPTPEPTPTAVPTATPTVAPTATPKPTPKPKAAFKNLSELKSAVSAYFDNASQKWTAIGNSENLKNHNVPNTDTTYYEYYGPIEDWNTSQVTDMSGLFQGHGEFNGDISKWNTSSVTNMKNMFYNAQKFNQDINTKTVTLDNGTTYTAWDVSNVQNMESMFSEAREFNQDLNRWNTINVTGDYNKGGMQTMFLSAVKFNGNISNWNVTNVYNMKAMFSRAFKFNRDISSWIPSKCEYFGYMFYEAKSFNQNLSSWTARIPSRADPHSGNDEIFIGSPLVSEPSKQFTF